MDRPDRPDLPSHLKYCSDERDDYVESLPGRSQTTRTTETTSIAWIELSSLRTIVSKRSYGNALRRLRRSGRSKAIPEVITTIPVIENKFGLDAAEVEKIIRKCLHRVLALFETRESQVLHVILCLRGTLLACRRRKIERKER